MDRVFDVVAQAGSLPIEELKLRSGMPNVAFDLNRLKQQGLVEVKQEVLPESEGPVDIISLTRKGFKASLR